MLHAKHEIELTMLSNPVNALQFYLGGLSLGLAVRMLDSNVKFNEPTGREWYLGGTPVDMPKGKGRQSQGKGNRMVSISKNLSRALRHGKDKNGEIEIRLDLNDGASALVNDLVAHPTFARLAATVDDIKSCAQEKGRDQKYRFDVYEANDGWRIRAFQGHTAHAVVAPEHSRGLTQRYLIRATDVATARCITKECLKLVTSRREFHFVGNHFTYRQRRYLKDSGGRHGIRIILDAHKAISQGMLFRHLPNDVIVTTGIRVGYPLLALSQYGRIRIPCMTSKHSDWKPLYS